MKPVIYLDYDGVCASHAHWLSYDEDAPSGAKSTDEADLFALKNQACPWAMRNLKMLAEVTNAQIVIASSRRRNFGSLLVWQEFLASFGIDRQKVVGLTNRDLCKTQAIKEWHEANQDDISVGMVIDDSNSVKEGIEKFGIVTLMVCKTNQLDGLTYSDVFWTAQRMNPGWKPPVICM